MENNRKENEEYEVKPFKTRGSSEFILVVGYLCYVAAIFAVIALIYYYVSNKGNSILRASCWYVIIGGLFTGSILVTLYNITEDLHYNSYCTELLLKESTRINSLVLNRLENMDYNIYCMVSSSSNQVMDTPSPDPSSRVRFNEDKKEPFSEIQDDPDSEK